VVHANVHEFEDILGAEFQGNVEIFIHADPCLDDCCYYCKVQDCPIRKFLFPKLLNGMKSIYRLIKNTSLKAYSLIALAFVCCVLGLSGCLQGFTMSASQVDEYYAALPPKPDFSYAEYEHKKIYFAQSTNVRHKLLFLIHGAPGAWFGYKDYLNDSLLLQKFKIVAADRFGYNHLIES
jgi:hypothetical protein